MRCFKRWFFATLIAAAGGLVIAPVTWGQTLDWEPKFLPFGRVLIGNTAFRTLTLANTDTSQPIEITAIEYTFNQMDSFGWSTVEPPPVDIPPGGSMDVELSFTPKDISFSMADLQITNSSTNAPVLIYSFFGEGVLTTTTTSSTTTTLAESDCGDPSGDGEITATDALFTLSAAVGIQECIVSVCDVNDDGKVAASDALAVLNVAVGIPVVLRCPA